MNNLNDSQIEKIYKLKKNYTLELAGIFFMFTLTNTLILTRDLFGFLPRQEFGYFLDNPGIYILFSFFIKYLIDLTVDIQNIINE